MSFCVSILIDVLPARIKRLPDNARVPLVLEYNSMENRAPG